MPANTAKYDEWRANFGGRQASWIAHGTFGSDVTLTDQGSGNYGTTLTRPDAGTGYDVQVLRSDASSHWPGSPAKITADANGNINLNFYELQAATWGDGWSPELRTALATMTRISSAGKSSATSIPMYGLPRMTPRFS